MTYKLEIIGEADEEIVEPIAGTNSKVKGWGTGSFYNWKPFSIKYQ